MTERAVIYKILKVLHHEPKEDDFQKCLIGFQELLSSGDMYADFKTYFNENYVNIVERWATCYRLRCMGTNNFIESFHSSFKMRYLGGKVNNRVERCLHALLKYARDHIFKRAWKLSKQLLTRLITRELCLGTRKLRRWTFKWSHLATKVGRLTRNLRRDHLHR